MLYPILIPLCVILLVLLSLRLWTVMFTDYPITKVEGILRSFVCGFREGYSGTPQETPVAHQPSVNVEKCQTLTFEVAELMAEQLIAEAWSEAKASSRQNNV